MTICRQHFTVQQKKIASSLDRYRCEKKETSKISHVTALKVSEVDINGIFKKQAKHLMLSV